MAVITIRNVPESLLEKLKAIAERNHRSLQQQLLALLHQAPVLDKVSHLERAAAIRKRLKRRKLGNVVDDVRAERAR